MEEHRAFFYGTLMVPQVLHRVIYGSTTPHESQLAAVKIFPALLPNHRRHRVVGCDYPAIVESSDESACVRGTYVEGLTAADMWRLDIFEGDEYERVSVSLRLLDQGGVPGESKVAETYRWIMPSEQLEDREWDFEEFRRDKLRDWVGGNASVDYYDEVDEAVSKFDEGKNGTGGRFVNGSLAPGYDGNQTAAS